MQNDTDPHLIYYYPPQRTENDDCLYEFQINEHKPLHPQKALECNKTEGKRNIELTLALSAQNDQLVKKIKEVKDAISSEELKGNIFKKKFEENQQQITDLKEKKEKMLQDAEKIKTLN